MMTQQIKYNTKTPQQLNSRIIGELATLITSGGEVDGSQVLNNLQRAGMISYVTVDGVISGVVVLKKPNISYRDKVFDASSTDENSNEYPLEVGYVYALPSIRGTRIIYNAFHQFTSGTYGKVFATVREDNRKAIRLLQRSGYIQSGNPYRSSRGDYNLLLWVSS